MALYWLALPLAMTARPDNPASLLRTSSVIPSAKYPSSAAPRFSKGSTASRFETEAPVGGVAVPLPRRASHTPPSARASAATTAPATTSPRRDGKAGATRALPARGARPEAVSRSSRFRSARISDACW